MSRRIATALLAAAVLAAAVLAAAVPFAHAEHRTPPPSAEGRDAGQTSRFDLDLEIRRDGFRLGGRLLGSSGVFGAWLNGRLRPGGFTLDGRLQQPGRAFNFNVQTETEAWLWSEGAWAL